MSLRTIKCIKCGNDKVYMKYDGGIIKDIYCCDCNENMEESIKIGDQQSDDSGYSDGTSSSFKSN